MLEHIWKSKNNKKGFTLVELIVVLVILAILLAVLVPAMTGWITKAKQQQSLTNGRVVYMACQTVASEDFAQTTPVVCTNTEQSGTVSATNTVAAGGSDSVKDVAALADLKLEYTVKFIADKSGKITTFIYTDATTKVELNAAGALEASKKVSG